MLLLVMRLMSDNTKIHRDSDNKIIIEEVREMKIIQGNIIKIVIFTVLSIPTFPAGPVLAAGEDYPSKPVTITVGMAPGAASGVSATILSEKIQKYVPKTQPFILNYKPGASGMMGLDYFMKQPADGYNLSWFEPSVIMKMAIEPSMYSFTLKDFSYIGTLATSPNAITVKADSPFKTLEDLIDYAKKHPMELKFCSSGVTGLSRLAGEVFMETTKIKMTHIPFAGGAPAVIALLGGHVTVYPGSIASVISYIKPGGGLRVLAVSYPKRLPEFGLADVPTCVERGYDVGDDSTFQGLIAKKETHKPILDILVNAFNKTGNDPDVQTALIKTGFKVENWDPKEMEKRSYMHYNRGREIFGKLGLLEKK